MRAIEPTTASHTVTASLEVVYNLVSMVATFGASTAWNQGVRVALSEAEKVSLREGLEIALESSARAAGEAITVETIETNAEALANAAEVGSIDWTLLDPTGIAALAVAFDYPRCEPGAPPAGGGTGAADSDNDTPLGAVIDPTLGCALDQLVPCAGPIGSSLHWKNHGEYVSTLTRTAKAFGELGLISSTQVAALTSAAAKSSCGQK